MVITRAIEEGSRAETKVSATLSQRQDDLFELSFPHEAAAAKIFRDAQAREGAYDFMKYVRKFERHGDKIQFEVNISRSALVNEKVKALINELNDVQMNVMVGKANGTERS